MYSVCARTDNSKFGLRYTKNLRTMGMRRSRGGGGIRTSLENSDLKSTPLSYRKKASQPRKTRISHGPPPPRPLEKIPYPLRKGTGGKQFLSEVR